MLQSTRGSSLVNKNLSVTIGYKLHFQTLNHTSLFNQMNHLRRVEFLSWPLNVVVGCARIYELELLSPARDHPNQHNLSSERNNKKSDYRSELNSQEEWHTRCIYINHPGSIKVLSRLTRRLRERVEKEKTKKKNEKNEHSAREKPREHPRQCRSEEHHFSLWAISGTFRLSVIAQKSQKSSLRALAHTHWMNK